MGDCVRCVIRRRRSQNERKLSLILISIHRACLIAPWAVNASAQALQHDAGYQFRHRSTNMSLRIGDTAPDFEVDTTQGRIKFHDWIGDSWAVLFSHPKDFTPVCTTELGYMARIKPEFDKRGVKIIGLSVDPVDHHSKWADDTKDTQGLA